MIVINLHNRVIAVQVQDNRWCQGSVELQLAAGRSVRTQDTGCRILQHQNASPPVYVTAGNLLAVKVSQLKLPITLYHWAQRPPECLFSVL